MTIKCQFESEEEASKILTLTVHMHESQAYENVCDCLNCKYQASSSVVYASEGIILQKNPIIEGV